MLGFGFGLTIYRVPLGGGTPRIPNIWFDDGTGYLNNPWDDNQIWEDFS